jgi:hypothetical protein
MRLSRLILSALVASAVALAPVAGALAAAAGTIEVQSHAKAPMEDCHKSASKTGSTGGHCPDCDTKGSCSTACLLKCFQLSATLEPVTPTLEIVLPSLPVTASAEPAGWSSRPPAPPPRA